MMSWIASMSLGRRVPTMLASNTDALVPEWFQEKILPSFSGNLLLSTGPLVHRIYHCHCRHCHLHIKITILMAQQGSQKNYFFWHLQISECHCITYNICNVCKEFYYFITKFTFLNYFITAVKIILVGNLTNSPWEVFLFSLYLCHLFICCFI